MEKLQDVKETYGGFHKTKNPANIYPTEWVVRTMQGTYPNLSFDKSKYNGGKILDMGFGDARNMPLLHNLGLDIYGVEITDDILALAKERLDKIGISATLKKGTNTSIPFPDNYFDYILSSFSCYYVDEGTTFQDNMKEYARVLKPGGVFITTLAEEQTFIFKNAEPVKDGHVIIKNDIYGLRNGYLMKCFYNREEIPQELGADFENFSIGSSLNDYFGVPISYYMVVCSKKK